MATKATGTRISRRARITKIRVKNAECLANYKKLKDSLALDNDLSDEDGVSSVQTSLKYLLEAKVISEVYSEFVSNLDTFGFDAACDQLNQNVGYFSIAVSAPNMDVLQNSIHQLTLRTWAEIAHLAHNS